MKGKKTKRMIIMFSLLLFALAALIIWILLANTALEVNTITINTSKIPEAFDGFCIAHVSDLHNTDLGNNNEKLINALDRAAPDIIAITGDMLDSRRPGYDISLSFAEKAVNIATCYYVPGNHEAKSSEYTAFKAKLLNLGVIILDDTSVELERNGQSITLTGICDPLFRTPTLSGSFAQVTDKRLSALTFDRNKYNLLLAHRPEHIDLYAKYGVDLVLSGHAHGGQARLPFIGGIYAPNQGLFPKYDSGLYTKNSTDMIVSRGIGKSVIPLRINNRPELVLSYFSFAEK